MDQDQVSHSCWRRRCKARTTIMRHDRHGMAMKMWLATEGLGASQLNGTRPRSTTHVQPYTTVALGNMPVVPVIGLAPEQMRFGGGGSTTHVLPSSTYCCGSKAESLRIYPTHKSNGPG